MDEEEKKEKLNEGEKAEQKEDKPASDKTERKIIFSLCYIWGLLFFIPLIMYKDDAEAKKHANNGLAMLLFSVVGNTVFGILTSFGGVMRTIFGALAGLYSLAILIIGIIGIIYVVNEEDKELPFFGKIKLLK
ncbi:MAG: hypothetical protein DBX59_02920 [Bacillota bacterium]|nr:MAG: hypothetical protein DBX59_02920 [Bacillota bacterium]